MVLYVYCSGYEVRGGQIMAIRNVPVCQLSIPSELLTPPGTVLVVVLYKQYI